MSHHRGGRLDVPLTKLVSGEGTVQDPDRLLQILVEHFRKLAESRLGDSSDGGDRREKMKMLELRSHMNEEYLLDVPFTAEEVIYGCVHAEKEGSTWSRCP